MSDLMQKLAMSKKIMDKHHRSTKRSIIRDLPMSENVNATYNIPENDRQSTDSTTDTTINTGNG